MNRLAFWKILVFISFLTPVAVNAQWTCESLINDAEQAYEAGLYDTVITNVERGLHECHFNRQEKQRILELLLKTQIDKENPEERDKVVVRLLRLNPNYKLINPQSGTSFNLAVQRYSAKPLLSFGLSGGLNIPLTHIQAVYSILEGADYSRNYSPKVSFLGCLHIEAELLKYLSVCFEPGISEVAYSRRIRGENNWNLVFSERQTNTDWMGFFKLNYPRTDFKISAEIGYCYTSIRGSTADVDLRYEAYNSITQQNEAYQISANKIDLKQDSLRVNGMNSLVLGLGGSYRIHSFIFFMDAKYFYSKNNLVERSNRFRSKLLSFDYYYIDNDFDLNRLQFQVGISYVFLYNIKKKK